MLSGNARTVFDTRFHAMNVVSGVHDAYFPQLTELYEMETGDNLSGHLDLALT